MNLNNIHNEDCLITMQSIPDGSIDLILTSPPYDGLRVYNGFSFNFPEVAKELYRITKIGGVVVWVVGDSTVNGSESGTSFKQALYCMDCGFRLHDTMIYAKNNYIPLTHNRYEQAFEYMFVFSKGKPKTFNPKMVDCKEAGVSRNLSKKGYCSTIKEGAQRRRDEITTTSQQKIAGNIFYYSCGAARTGHPAPFPEQLAADHIQSWSNPGDIVYDPFSGSGTTCKMAHILGRSWIGSEISEQYVRISRKRLSPILAVQNLFAA